VILMYHRILPLSYVRDNLMLPGMYVCPEVFDMQISYLKKIYKVISLSEYIKRSENHDWDYSKQYCIITFDDGWSDNYDHAFPVLKKHKLPATVFLATSFVGTEKRFWPEKLSFIFSRLNTSDMMTDDVKAYLNESSSSFGLDVYDYVLQVVRNTGLRKSEFFHSLIEKLKTLPEAIIEEIISYLEEILHIKYPPERLFLNWDEINEMSDHSISFGSHGLNHKILTKLSQEELIAELQGSMDCLVKKHISHVPILCYPNGTFNTLVINFVKEVGYRASVTTSFGVEELGRESLFELRRIGIHNDITHRKALFFLRISGLRTSNLCNI